MAPRAEPQETPAPARKRRIPLIVAIVLGLAAGGGGGVYLVGPLLAERPPRGATPPQEKGHGAAGAPAEGHAEAAPVVLQIENLVLNPAGSEGMRFLMVTVALGLASEEAVAELKARDAEVRDAVLGVLATKTVPELTDVARRPALKDEVRAAAAALLPEGAVQRVFFPQFVIQ